MATPELDWLLLTKRPGRIVKILKRTADLADDTRREVDRNAAALLFHAHAKKETGCGYEELGDVARWVREWVGGEPPPNVWIGTSVESQQVADSRVWPLLTTPATLHFVSAEPLLSRVDFDRCRADVEGRYVNAFTGVPYVDDVGLSDRPQELVEAGPIEADAADRLRWIIFGGESGPRCRRFPEREALRMIRKAKREGCAVYLKQLGGHPDKRGGDDARIKGERFAETPAATPAAASLVDQVVQRIRDVNRRLRGLEESGPVAGGDLDLKRELSAEKRRLANYAADVRRGQLRPHA